MNTLFQGDNLAILREMPDASVDLICTDPPFNTGKDWGAFNDKWEGGLKGYLKFMEARCVEMRRVLKGYGQPVSALRSNGKPLFEGDVGRRVWDQAVS